MRSRQKQAEFVLQYLRENYVTDIYDQKFHDEFYNRFGGKRIVYPFGSCPVNKAQRLLSAMYKSGQLNRERVSLYGHEAGFRNWVYVYRCNAA